MNRLPRFSLQLCTLALSTVGTLSAAWSDVPSNPPAVDSPPAADSFETVSHDASSLLPRPAALEPAVRFWIRVYTEISTNAGFLHDQENLAIVYETLQFEPATSASQRQRRVDAEKARLHALLLRLAQGATPATPEEQRIRALWGDAGTPARLAAAAEDVRFQLGQADRFRSGLIRAGAWQRHIAEVLARLGLPPELAALPDVESSFDPRAYSKVGAAGLWQFLRSTGRRFLRINAAVDERFDPFRETEAAAQLLSYNYRLLGSWPLAITAYNHGAAGMLRAREQLGTDDIVRILHDYHSATFGFASRNFYVSFLAALEVSRTPEKYFGALPIHEDTSFQELRMSVAASAAALVQTLNVDRDALEELNPALRPAVWRGRRPIPAGYLLRLPATSVQWTPQLLAQRLGGAQLVAVDTVASAPVDRAQARHAARVAVAAFPAAPPSMDMLSAVSANAPVSPLLETPVSRSSAFLSRAPGASADLSAPEPTAQEALDYYLVKPGDTINLIAEQTGVPIGELLMLNSLPDQDFLYEGERLRLAASVPEPGVASNPGIAALAQQAVQENSAEQQAVALANHQAASAEPVSAAQAQAEGPQLGPGATGPQSADPIDYSVAADGSIRVAAAETLGHYAEWLDTNPARLRTLNHLHARTAVQMGRRVRLEFDAVNAQQFEQRRRDYHEQLQAAYFASHRIVGSTMYAARRGDSLWTITKRNFKLPIWLLQQYNPELDFGNLHPGTLVSLPKVEDLATS